MDNKSDTPATSIPHASKAIRDHEDGREFRPWWLLAVTVAISIVLAAISYTLQVYFIGPS